MNSFFMNRGLKQNGSSLNPNASKNERGGRTKEDKKQDRSYEMEMERDRTLRSS